jgi:hypothetical protein
LFARPSHFEYVKSEDLEKIGMGRPAIRRLMDAVKRRKQLKKKGLLDKVENHFIWECVVPKLALGDVSVRGDNVLQ